MRPPTPKLASQYGLSSPILAAGLFAGLLITAWSWLKLPNQFITLLTWFSLSVSFAILGISFQAQEDTTRILNLSLPDMQRITGLLIFWFGYILFVQFNRYTSYLRSQLRKMEKEKRVDFSIQLDADHFMYSKFKAAFSARWLLFYFGIIYSFIVFLMAMSSYSK